MARYAFRKIQFPLDRILVVTTILNGIKSRIMDDVESTNFADINNNPTVVIEYHLFYYTGLTWFWQVCSRLFGQSMSENLMLIKSRNILTGNKNNEEHWGDKVATMPTEHAKVIAMPIIARQDVAFAA